jgi:hypothetical protein
MGVLAENAVRGLIIGGLVGWMTLAGSVPARTEPPYDRATIPHRDGSGRATIVEIHPDVPGAREFVRSEERPAPARGALELPTPTARATGSPAPTPTPRRH